MYVCDPGPQKQSGEIEIWDLYIIWINTLSIGVWFIMIGQYLILYEIWGYKKKSKYWEITFKVVKMKFLAMHITNQKIRFYIFMVGNLLNIFMEHDLYFISL